MESEELDSLPKRQFKKAEIADAVMGTEASLSPSDIESFIPKNMNAPQAGGFSPPCDESSDQCAEPAGAADEDTSSESSQQVPDQELYYMIIGIRNILGLIIIT